MTDDEADYAFNLAMAQQPMLQGPDGNPLPLGSPAPLPLAKGRRLTINGVQLLALLKGRKHEPGEGQASLFEAHHGALVPSRITVAGHTRSDGVHVKQHQTTVYVRPEEHHAAPVANEAAPPAAVPLPPTKARLTELGKLLEHASLRPLEGKADKIGNRLVQMGEWDYCSRCSGSGRYSFNLTDGDRCFGCGGTGKAVPALTDERYTSIVRNVQGGSLDRYAAEVRAKSAAKREAERLIKDGATLPHLVGELMYPRDESGKQARDSVLYPNGSLWPGHARASALMGTPGPWTLTHGLASLVRDAKPADRDRAQAIVEAVAPRLAPYMDVFNAVTKRLMDDGKLGADNDPKIPPGRLDRRWEEGEWTHERAAVQGAVADAARAEVGAMMYDGLKAAGLPMGPWPVQDGTVYFTPTGARNVQANVLTLDPSRWTSWWRMEGRRLPKADAPEGAAVVGDSEDYAGQVAVKTGAHGGGAWTASAEARPVVYTWPTAPDARTALDAGLMPLHPELADPTRKHGPEWYSLFGRYGSPDGVRAMLDATVEPITKARPTQASLEAAGQSSMFGAPAGGGAHAKLVPKHVTVGAHTRADGTHVPQHQTTVYVHPDEAVAHHAAPVHADPVARGASPDYEHGTAPPKEQPVQTTPTTHDGTDADAMLARVKKAAPGNEEVRQHLLHHRAAKIEADRLRAAGRPVQAGHRDLEAAQHLALGHALLPKLAADGLPDHAAHYAPEVMEAVRAVEAGQRPDPAVARRKEFAELVTTTKNLTAHDRRVKGPVSYALAPAGRALLDKISNVELVRKTRAAKAEKAQGEAAAPAATPAPAAPLPPEQVHKVLATSDGRHVAVHGTVRTLPSGAQRVTVHKADAGTPTSHATDTSHALDDSWTPHGSEAPKPELPETPGASENLREALQLTAPMARAGDPLVQLRHVVDQFERGGNDMPHAERTAIYGIVHAMETGRLDGTVHKTISGLPADKLEQLIVNAARANKTIGDVPRWLNQHGPGAPGADKEPAPPAAAPPGRWDEEHARATHVQLNHLQQANPKHADAIEDDWRDAHRRARDSIDSKSVSWEPSGVFKPMHFTAHVNGKPEHGRSDHGHKGAERALNELAAHVATRDTLAKWKPKLAAAATEHLSDHEKVLHDAVVHHLDEQRSKGFDPGTLGLTAREFSAHARKHAKGAPERAEAINAAHETLLDSGRAGNANTAATTFKSSKTRERLIDALQAGGHVKAERSPRGQITGYTMQPKG